MSSALLSPSQLHQGGAPGRWSRSRVLWMACLAHALHDGFTDMIYVLLPVWQTEFGLSYGAVALLRGIYAGTMATLQLPVGRLNDRLGGRLTLTLGTTLAAAGYCLAGMSGSLLGLCIALAISGGGSSTQHPIASAAVSRVYQPNARGALGIYNFSGDLGKAALPAAISLLVTFMSWRHALWIVSAVGMAVAACMALLLPSLPRNPQKPARAVQGEHPYSLGKGFLLLAGIGILDTAVRMGLLTFLPFLLKEKGASMPVIGTAMALVFVGGAAGKFACGWRGARVGVVGTVLATEGGTALGIVAVLLAPLPFAIGLLPLLGVMLNGTSSVLYGTVPELAAPDRTEHAFAVFYTGTIGSGAISPVVYGVLGDHIGIHAATMATAVTALAILPFALSLRPFLMFEK